MTRNDPRATEIERILERFDFKYISLVMHLINRKWNRLGRTPSCLDLRDEAETLLNAVVHQGPGGRGASGGLVAEWIRDADDKSRLRLLFVLEEADGEP